VSIAVYWIICKMLDTIEMSAFQAGWKMRGIPAAFGGEASESTAAEDPCPGEFAVKICGVALITTESGRESATQNQKLHAR
jgi:hypothetical protein